MTPATKRRKTIIEMILSKPVRIGRHAASITANPTAAMPSSWPTDRAIPPPPAAAKPSAENTDATAPIGSVT